MKLPSRQSGFTIVELAIIVPILVVVVLVLFDALFYLIRNSHIDQAKINTTYEAQNALNVMESDAVFATTFLYTTDTDVVDAYKPTTNGGAWSYIGDSLESDERVLIMRVYNTSANPLSSSRKPSFLSEEGCTPSTIYFNDVARYNLIYFVKDNNLYRRYALNPSQTTCESIYQKQSCPSLESLGLPSRDSSCQADDELVAKNVTRFEVQYYPSKNSSTPIDVYDPLADPEAVTAAAAVEVSLTITQKAYGNDISSSSSMRIAKINAPIEEEE